MQVGHQTRRLTNQKKVDKQKGQNTKRPTNKKFNKLKD